MLFRFRLQMALRSGRTKGSSTTSDRKPYALASTGRSVLIADVTMSAFS